MCLIMQQCLLGILRVDQGGLWERVVKPALLLGLAALEEVDLPKSWVESYKQVLFPTWDPWPTQHLLFPGKPHTDAAGPRGPPLLAGTKRRQLTTACLFWLGLHAWLTSHPGGSKASTSTSREGRSPTLSGAELGAGASAEQRGPELGACDGVEGRFLAWVTQDKQPSWERPEQRKERELELQQQGGNMDSRQQPQFLQFHNGFCPQAASPGTTDRTGKHDPKQVPVQSLQSILLRRLGLQRRPEPKPGLVVPQYLLELYQFYLGKAPSSFGGAELPFLEERGGRANTVRMFQHVEDLGPVPEAVGGALYFRFNLTLLPADEELMALELRLYHPQQESKGFHVNVYHVMDPLPISRNKSRLLARRFLASKQPKWESFDVSAAFKKATGQKHHLGFLVEVEHHQVSLRVRRSLGEAQERPLLVAYSRDWNGQSLSRGKRQNRSQRGGPSLKGGRRTAKVAAPQSKGKKRGKPKAKASARCRRHRLFVDFKAVGWNDWIIAPSGYHAFYCSGECRFPLADHMNSSSHAVVQTMLSSVNARVPKACCVPTDLSPVTMLYLDQHDMVVLKTYQDMVVEGCGCR